MRHIVKKFDSLLQYSRYLEQTTNKIFNGHECSKTGGKGFTGTASFDEAQELLKFGDNENFQMLKAEMLKSSLNLKGSGEQIKTQTYCSYVGYAPHVPSFVAGKPTTMLRKKNVKTYNNKVLNILYNPTANGDIDAKSLIRASIEVLNFISGLEKKGYKINLYNIISAKGFKETLTQIVKIKSSDDYTDLKKMVYPMVNPSFLRRHSFRFMEVEKDLADRYFRGGYGSALYDEEEIQPILQQCNMKVDYYISFYGYQNQINKYKATAR